MSINNNEEKVIVRTIAEPTIFRTQQYTSNYRNITAPNKNKLNDYVAKNKNVKSEVKIYNLETINNSEPIVKVSNLEIIVAKEEVVKPVTKLFSDIVKSYADTKNVVAPIKENYVPVKKITSPIMETAKSPTMIAVSPFPAKENKNTVEEWVVIGEKEKKIQQQKLKDKLDISNGWSIK